MPSMPTASDGSERRFQQATYWLIIAGIYFLVGVLFFYSGKGKLFDDDGHAPPALEKQFDGTFLDKARAPTPPGSSSASSSFSSS